MHRLFTSIIVTISLKMKTGVNIAIHVTHCHCVQEWVTRLSPCASLFPSLFLSNVFINMTVIMAPVTKHARLCQNSLPESILCGFTRWCPRNLQSFAWILVNCRVRHRFVQLSPTITYVTEKLTRINHNGSSHCSESQGANCQIVTGIFLFHCVLIASFK